MAKNKKMTETHALRHRLIDIATGLHQTIFPGA